jgi:hypothetical protein
MPNTFRRPTLTLLAGAACALPLAAQAATPYLLPAQFSTQANHTTVQAAQVMESYFTPFSTLRGGSYTLFQPDGSSVTPPKVVDLTDVTVIEAPLPVTGTYRLTTGPWVTRTTKMVKIDGAWKMIRPPQAPGGRPGGGGEGGPARPGARPGGEGAPAGGPGPAGAAARPPGPPANSRFVEEADVPAGAETVTTQGITIVDTYITRGGPNDTVLKPTGQGMELIPSQNPNDLYGGDAPSFKLTLDGKPLAGADVSVHAAGNTYQEKIVFAHGETAADGTFKQAYPPGVYSLAVVYPAATPPNPTAPPVMKSYVYTVTFEVSR